MLRLITYMITSVGILALVVTGCILLYALLESCTLNTVIVTVTLIACVGLTVLGCKSPPLLFYPTHLTLHFLLSYLVSGPTKGLLPPSIIGL